MAKISFNPKLYVEPAAPVAADPVAPSVVYLDKPIYIDRIVEKRVEVPGPAVEVIKEIMVPGPVQIVEKEVIKYVDRAVETIKEVIIDRPIEVIKEVPTIVTHHIEVPVEREVIKEVLVDRIVEKVVQLPAEIIEVTKEVKVLEEKIIEKFVHVTPKWIVGLLASETVLLAIVLIHKLLS